MMKESRVDEWSQSVESAVMEYKVKVDKDVGGFQENMLRVWCEEMLDKQSTKCQKLLQDIIDEESKERLLLRIMDREDDVRAVQKFHSASHRLAGKFLFCIPRSDKEKIANRDFELMMGLRLNNNLSIAGGFKGSKGEEVDQYGDYHLKSANAKGGWDQRHNNVRDEYVAMAESAGISVERESQLGYLVGKTNVDLTSYSASVRYSRTEMSYSMFR
jgi:hypothetical protein